MKRFRNASILIATAAGFLFPGMAILGTRIPVVIASSFANPDAPTASDPGAEVYARECAICHGDKREGILPAFPPLLGITHRLTEPQITDLIVKGKERMPGYPNLKPQEMAALVRFLTTSPLDAGSSDGDSEAGKVKAGGILYQQNCAFCHGRDTMGGETGPDLTQSKIVLDDDYDDKIAAVVREGRVEKKMPAFNFSKDELENLAAFIHSQLLVAQSKKGGRRGVTVADLQTGKVDLGKQYFNGAGGCSKCHSPTGDLAGLATRFEGLKLEQRMLYPSGAKSRVTVTLPSGESVSGTVAYQDEFTIGLRDQNGFYHSWLTNRVKFKIDSPVDAHVEQFPKYTDDDIHNLMAYLQTLR